MLTTLFLFLEDLWFWPKVVSVRPSKQDFPEVDKLQVEGRKVINLVFFFFQKIENKVRVGATLAPPPLQKYSTKETQRQHTPIHSMHFCANYENF